MNKKPIKLLFEAMYHGKYDFSDFAQGDIASNYEATPVKGRLIYKANKKLKAYHTFLNLFLFEYLKTNKDVVFSYRKGFNVYDAVSRHASSKYFFQTDICNFFPNLDSSLIRQAIVDGADLSPIADVNNYLERILSLVTINNALPVGFATSPLLSNSCLYSFDNELALICSERGLVYTRYSDDLIISSAEKSAISEIAPTIESTLNKCFGGKLSINNGKSKFTQVGNKIKLLGMVILPNGKVSIDMKFKKEIEVLIYFYINHKERFMDKAGGDIGSGVARISGYLNYVNTVDKAYLDKLRKKFGATIIDTFIHNSAE